MFISINTQELKDNLSGTFIMDFRNAEEYLNGFIPGAVWIPFRDTLPEWFQELRKQTDAVCVVAGKKDREILEKQLRNSGLLQVQWLEGGWKAWQKAGFGYDMVVEIEADELAMDLPFDEHLVLLDVRSAEEFDAAHVDMAGNMPLDEFADLVAIAALPETGNFYVYGNGNEALLAAGLLKRQGIHMVRYVAGGWENLENSEALTIVKAKPKKKDV